MTKECQVCFEYRTNSSFRKITANCYHGLNICVSCVNRHISAQLDSKGVEINCPFNGCNQRMQHDDIKKVNMKLFERFDALVLRQALSKLPEFRWCKTLGCDSGQLHLEGDNAPIMTCQSCGQKSCYTHDVPWHEGITCANYESNKRGHDKETRDLLERETKPCPRCGVRITKDGGCNHMTCKVKTCRFEFCWLCSADYSMIRMNGNTFHERTCELYA